MGAGAAGGGLKGAFGSLMSDDGTIGSGFVEGAAYGGVGTGMLAGAGKIKHAGGKMAMAMAGAGLGYKYHLKIGEMTRPVMRV